MDEIGNRFVQEVYDVTAERKYIKQVNIKKQP